MGTSGNMGQVRTVYGYTTSTTAAVVPSVPSTVLHTDTYDGRRVQCICSRIIR